MRFFAWKENFAKADALIVENRPLPDVPVPGVGFPRDQGFRISRNLFELYPTAVRPHGTA